MVKGVKGSGFIQCVLCRVHSVCRVYGETVHVDGDLVRCLVPDPRCVPPHLLGACRQGMSALVSALVGDLLDSSPGNSVVAYLYHTVEVGGIGGDNVGLIKSTKAPESQP